MAQLQSLASLTLDLPPSCIAFCPSKPQFFVVGTYLLHAKEQRSGGSNTAGAGDDEAHGSIQREGESVADESGNGMQVRSGSLILFRLNLDGDEVGEMM